MYKSFLFFLFFIAANTAVSQSIIGSWQGDDGDQIGTITFDDEGYCTMVVGNQTMGGKEFESDGNKGSMTYAIDKSQTPIAITLTVTRFATETDPEFATNMYGLIKFKDDNNITLALGNPEQKVTEFTPDNSIELTRQDD